MSSDALVSFNHAFGGWNYHLQFTPAFRRDVFRDEVLKEACAREAKRVADALGVELAAAEFGPDHWHLFVCKCKNYSAAKLAQRFKGATSRFLRKNFRERVREKLWGDRFWTQGYFAETVGRVTSETVRYYIERGQAKHWQPRQTTLQSF